MRASCFALCVSLVFCGALLLCDVPLAVAQPLPSAQPGQVGLAAEPLAELDARMQSYINEGKLAGIVMLVAREGKVGHLGTYGQMDIENKLPMRRDAIFRIYSMTKPITGVALMTLFEEGRFELDDPVAKYLPGFEKLKVFASEADGKINTVDLKRPVTVRDLMCHTAGLAYGLFPASPVDEMYKQAKILDRTQNLDSMLERLLKLPLASQPGEKWMYSISVDVQGKLIEKLSGKPLDVYLAERVFKPLAMHDTSFFVPADKLDRMTVNYGLVKGKLSPIDGSKTSQFATRPTLFSGGGGLASTADDYLRFCQMMLNKGELGGVRILKPETVELMSRNHLPKEVLPIRLGPLSIPNMGFGLDFAVRTNVGEGEPQGSLGEYWWGGAASTQFFIAPKDNLICIGMTQFMPSSPLYFQDARKKVYQAVLEPVAK